MDNCKHCNKPIESHTGRRPKLYCNDVCRNAYFNAQKGKESTKVWKSTYDEVVLENKALKARIKELEILANPVSERNAEKWGNGNDKELINQAADISKEAILNLPSINGSDSPALEGVNVAKDFAEGANKKVLTEIISNQNIFTPTKEDEIARLEGEMALLGKGALGDKMKKILQGKINKLKYS